MADFNKPVVLNLAQEHTVHGRFFMYKLMIANQSSQPTAVNFTPLGEVPAEPFFLVVQGLSTLLVSMPIEFSDGVRIAQLDDKVNLLFVKLPTDPLHKVLPV